MQTILIVGTGFAGMWSALSAMRLIEQNGGSEASGIRVIVISPEPTLVIRPRLYESDADKMCVSLEELFRVTGIQFVPGMVDTIDTAQKRATIIDMMGIHSALDYDRLVLAAGSHLKRPNIPDIHEHAFSIDQRDEAANLDKHLNHLAFEPPHPARNTIVIVGGGFTGIEIAAEMPSRLRSILRSEDVRVVIIEQADAIGPELGPGPRPVILEALAGLGVEYKLGAAVVSVDKTGVVTSRGERIDSLTVIWTGGVEASALTQQVPGQRDRSGRLHVSSDLRVPSVPDIYVTGDAALAIADDQGHHALMSCQHAMRLGRFAGHNAASDLLALAPKPYAQPAYGTCLDLGPWGAVITQGWDRQVQLTGSAAKTIKENINQVVIYPPKADRAEAFAAADPDSAGPTLA
ncbi:NAD(P)/FAD-dependent oxidoreductase [Aspergillus ruber CBS 135680]|uniref:FAD/NAD(P)-binding domain-containing protein n=1 Tax=Aspergillus ruber (strain CBS 135680) TaxID=1388766 RepID=A0A017S5C5_ASPRC|nr:FAD/NAD(P)-binding domain-containing protein [Aspergillus ruber CBS 135680]EYE92026.1 FAD/NAD(P)-binding domain-containing protein [Aspergillus ruber CBS 135680]